MDERKGGIKMKIGFVGIGVMGSRMVKRLLAANYDVTIYNRTKEKMKPLVELGAKPSANIPELAQDADVICTCLSMPADVEEIYLGGAGIIKHAKPKAICIDFTTVDPKTSRLVADAAQEKQIVYLDAPVSGGPEGAEAGSLTIMVGGKEEAFSAVAGLFDVLGQKIVYLGPSGSGSIAKLINQYLVAVHSLAASEAMVTGTALGLDSEQLYEILKVSYGYSRMLERHMENFVLDRNFAPGGAVKYVHKDVRLANELLKEAGLPQFLGELAQASFQKAIDEGHADEDMSSVIKPLEKIMNVEVKRKI